jgi:hypothetical protein
LAVSGGSVRLDSDYQIEWGGSTAGLYGSGANNTLHFFTNTTERARIDADGSLLLGRTSQVSGERLAIEGQTASWLVRVRNTRSSPGVQGMEIVYTANTPNNTGNPFLYAIDASALRLDVRSNGGIANYSANNVNLSDERVKTDIAPLGSYWDKIKALQVVTYKYLDQTHDDNNIGVIAQQVESVAPELVSNDGFGETPEDGVPLKSIYETDMHYATLKALQEAMTRIETLEAEVAALKGASA